MTSSLSVPPELQATADSVLRQFRAGVRDPADLKDIYRWLEDEGWDQLVDAPGEEIALKLGWIAQSRFMDDELRHDLDIPEEVEVQDADRIRWGRECIETEQKEDYQFVVPTLHLYPLKASDGFEAFIGCSVDIRPGGAECEWLGLWATRDEFYEAIAKDFRYWVPGRMGDIPDEVILSLWQRPKRRRK